MLLAKYVFRNITRRPTVVGITLVIMMLTSFALLSIVSFDAGLSSLLERSGSPRRALILSPPTTRGLYESHLALRDIHDVTASPLVRKTSVQTMFVVPLYVGIVPEFTNVRGLDSSGFDLYGARIVEGRLPRQGERELVVGRIVQQRHQSVQVGSSVLVSVHKFTVVGVFETGAVLDGELWTSRDALAAELRQDEPSLAVLELDSATDATHLANEYAERRLGYGLVPEGDYYTRLNAENTLLYQSLLLIAILVSLGAATSIVGTMSVVFAGRVVEMSVLRAIGFRSSQIGTLMFGEALLLTAIGGSMGIALALVSLRGYCAYAGVSMYFVPRFAATDIALAFTAVLIIGVLGAVVPIVRMLRMNTVDGLR